MTQVCYLETERLRLRAINKSDAEHLHALNSDPEVMRYLGPEHNTLEGAREALVKVVERNIKYQNQLGLFAAFTKNSNEYIGWFILRPDKNEPEDLRNLEVGYRLLKTHWGKGYATEVTLKLIEKARQDFKVRRIYAKAMKANVGSWRVMEKVGLKFEKTYTELNFSGEDKEAVVYSMTYK